MNVMNISIFGRQRQGLIPILLLGVKLKSSFSLLMMMLMYDYKNYLSEIQ